jgi:hypothetical protein
MNQLKVNQQQSMAALHEQGLSKRRIAREFGVVRRTPLVRPLSAEKKMDSHGLLSLLLSFVGC